MSYQTDLDNNSAVMRDFTLADLKEEGKRLGIRGVSSMTKGRLAALIARKWARIDNPAPVMPGAWN